MANDFFDTVELGQMSEEQLLKSLQAGYGTDSADFRGGRALVAEDIEVTMINAMREQREDCKMMNTIKKRPVSSTVHEYNVTDDVGTHEFLSVPEGGGSETSDRSIRRVTRQIKYLQDRRAVTDQMEIVSTFEDVFEAEKLAGTLNVLKGAEYLCFHGDSSVVPVQFDGIPVQIEKSLDPNILDVRGESIGKKGEAIITDPVGVIFEKGGDANKLFFPPILAQDIQDLIRDRIRFGTDGSGAMSLVVDKYPTPYGSTVSFGVDEGADKFYKVKGVVTAAGSTVRRPEPPASVTATASADSKSKFQNTDAGNYKYTVHSINAYGISESKELDAAVAVAAGNKVTLEIEPSAKGDETGYIICRSAKDGDVVMEMVRIGRQTEKTTFDDLNKDLPGTASMLFLTEKKLQTVVEWFQLIPLRLRPLYESNKAETPFFIQLFGAVEAKVPSWCALVKNIAYRGGFKY